MWTFDSSSAKQTLRHLLLLLSFIAASSRNLVCGFVVAPPAPSPSSPTSSSSSSIHPHFRQERIRLRGQLLHVRYRPVCSTSFPNPRSTMASASATATALHLDQYAPQAVSLFNNMKTPASILAGALVPLGLLAPLPEAVQDAPAVPTSSKKSSSSTKMSSLRLLVPRILRRSYVVVAVLSLLSELISVMWATVAVNQLIETHVAPAESVWHLLRRDFDLAWLGTNAHFVAGMFGFSYVIALRAALGHAGPIGRAVSSFALASLLLMVAIVNRGVSSGSGDGMRYGASVASLFSTYLKTLFRRATHKDTFGPLEVGSMLVFAWGIVASVVAVSRAAIEDVKDK